MHDEGGRASGGGRPGAQWDPLGWCANWVPERVLHRLVRVAMGAVVLGFLVLRLAEYPHYTLKPLWAVETLLFAVLLGAYGVRRDPVDRARGVREILVPLLGAVLPFGLLLSPSHPALATRPGLVLALFWWMAAGTALTVWGMWSLRRAFSITVEARVVVSCGPYRRLRHPIYTGEWRTTAGVAVWRWSALGAVVLLAFGVVQLLRARWEEQKLACNFPEYREVQRRAWWIW